MLARQIIRRVATQTSRSAAMSTLVVAEHNQAQISGATLATVTAASQIGGDITLLVMGSQAGPAAEAAAKVAGVKNVLHAADPKYDHLVAEEVAELLVAAQKADNYSHVLAPSSNASKNYLPRAGAKLDVAPISDILAVADKDTFFRPTYAGNAIAQVTSKDAVKLITVRPTGFEKAAAEGGNASVGPAPEAPTVGKTSFVSEEVSKSERPDLASARVVISGGRGLKSGENFEMLYKLADKLGGAVGASRAAVDAGFVPNELQVGQTGKVVAPELYVAAGISGAIQHLAGMKDSKTIVAINKDEEAPIFQVADYGLVDDLFNAVPELTEKI
ncbi:Electron transfer flavoprotein subunit alpha [Phytophthora fragariae]|uniref:Electron transfer flavoprotein subunit alpha n=1 Tax=Phytophthora fragariae TaxID=53985 RepID=A0A6A3G4D1_9STRA|nr:Electron transfer flavoprotein subunit alpha [Phytophthora fragariae]KAE8948798.1 Electron transfer flavoprotein subunit alpha [Phytophthora fragariae]KAE9029532.1 Electron transfer flavoprotein subunit alpha [Phytophthora fragariae]KAE9138078.1 Electron transfer flavoprotein subunit alpha [Phytophthora fragariae]KAE9154641.1 Electron transfer flavoprotein subunit alpha [Phytophthora fragariae]